MKKLTLLAALLVSVSIFGQVSDYNKDRKFVDDFGYWSKSGNKEIIVYNPSPVGYMKTYKEMLSVLGFYGIDYDDTRADKTLLSGNTQIDDYSTMNLDLSIEYAVVVKMWVKNNVTVFWICNDKSYSLTIDQK